MERRKNRWNNRQTLFYRAVLATMVGPTSTTAVDWHLKVRDTENDVGLPNYCITICMQKPAQFVNSFLRYSRF